MRAGSTGHCQAALEVGCEEYREQYDRALNSARRNGHAEVTDLLLSHHHDSNSLPLHEEAVCINTNSPSVDDMDEFIAWQ